MNKRNDEAHYFHTLADFYEIMEAHGAKQVINDMEGLSPLLYGMLESAVKERADQRKQAALLNYKDVFFGEYEEHVNG